MVDLPLCWVVVSTWWLLLMDDHLPDDFWRNSWISMDELMSLFLRLQFHHSTGWVEHVRMPLLHSKLSYWNFVLVLRGV